MTRPDQLAAEVRRTGAAVWPGFVDGEALTCLQQSSRAVASGEHALRFPTSTRVWDLYRHGATYLDLLTRPDLTELLDLLLGENYLLSDFSLNTVHPGGRPDRWHLDYPFNEMPDLATGPLLGIQCVLALDAFSGTNGATQYVPGSHDPPRRPDPAEVSTIWSPLLMPGSMLMMGAATWHRSGVNTSTAPRSAILLSFVERWIRPMTEPPEPGLWSATQRLRLLLGMQRPPETIDGHPVTGP